MSTNFMRLGGHAVDGIDRACIITERVGGIWKRCATLARKLASDDGREREFTIRAGPCSHHLLNFSAGSCLRQLDSRVSLKIKKTKYECRKLVRN